MSRIARTRTFALAVVAALGLALVAGLSVGRAESPPNLPPISADRLIASSLRALAERTPVSGTVTTHFDLGLPQLPGTLGGQTGAASILLSDQTFKEWRSPDGVRVAQILPFAERVVVVNRSDMWLWDSQQATAWHLAVPQDLMPGSAQGSTGTEVSSLGDLEAIAQKALQAAEPYATVSVSGTAWVAGRAAYVVTLTPTSKDTLVGRIEVAIDSETRVPLQLEVFPRGSLDPAIRIGFTSVGFGPIDPAMFTFTPPPGAVVKQVQVPAEMGQDTHEQRVGAESASGNMPEVRTFGEGFDLIVAVRVTDVPKDLRSLFPYAGPLGSADLVSRGDHAWVVAGAVPSNALAGVEPKLP